MSAFGSSVDHVSNKIHRIHIHDLTQINTIIQEVTHSIHLVFIRTAGEKGLNAHDLRVFR
jgi:hypothetical protein